MIEKFAETLEYEVPETLQSLVVGFILGQTEKAVKEVVPMYPSGFPLLFSIYGCTPYLTIDGLKQPTTSRLVVAGQICDAEIKLHIEGLFGQVGVVLHPTALYYLFHKTGDSFLNGWKTFQESSPITTDVLMDNLSESRSVEDRISYLTGFLELLEKQRIEPILWLEASLVKIFTRNGKISQEELVKDTKVSTRHFRRIFKRVIGVSPKYYCKVIQLASVFELLKYSEKEKLHHLALDCGYYDQAHFIHDFHRLIGKSPENFLQGQDSYLSTYMGRRGILEGL